MTVVRGPASRLRAPAGVRVLDAPADLRDALLVADVVVATGGQTALEAAACGTPAVLLALDEAQAAQATTLAAAGAALSQPARTTRSTRRGPCSPTRRGVNDSPPPGAAAVDGQGARRVARELSRLLGAAA